MGVKLRDDRPGILLTGATGFLGGEVLARLLERDRRPLCVLICEGENDAAARVAGLIATLLGPEGMGSC